MTWSTSETSAYRRRCDSRTISGLPPCSGRKSWMSSIGDGERENEKEGGEEEREEGRGVRGEKSEEEEKREERRGGRRESEERGERGEEGGRAG
eukprot:scaffold32031_cov22-Tisochrysis_lutea.AAC.2